MNLKLDFNLFGTSGLANLAKGLASNPSIEKLSLNFCGIDSEGSRYLQEILGYVNSKLWSLKLRGN